MDTEVCSPVMVCKMGTVEILFPGLASATDAAASFFVCVGYWFVVLLLAFATAATTTTTLTATTWNLRLFWVQ
jgi:hypothetical protein